MSQQALADVIGKSLNTVGLYERGLRQPSLETLCLLADTLEVSVEMNPEMFSDTVKQIEHREKELMEKLKSMLGIAAKVTLKAPKSMMRSEGKAVRVIDKRKI